MEPMKMVEPAKLMKMDRKTIEGIKNSAMSERDKARTSFDRQQGVINFCEWILQNCELEEEVKGDSNGSSDRVPDSNPT